MAHPSPILLEPCGKRIWPDGLTDDIYRPTPASGQVFAEYRVRRRSTIFERLRSNLLGGRWWAWRDRWPWLRRFDSYL